MSNESRTGDTYSVEMCCSNCGCRRLISFKCGCCVTAKHPCPNCDCVAMERVLFAHNFMAEQMDAYRLRRRES
jgi:hypothetical protein